MSKLSISTEYCVGEDGLVEVEGPEEEEETQIGANPTIRYGTVIYPSVVIGDEFQTGNFAMIREGTEIGDNVLVGSHTVIDGETTIGSNVSLQTGVYIPQETRIGNRVFFGPHAVVTNDPYPIRNESRIEETVISDDASIGANATILPGVSVGERAFVAAGAVIIDDVPPDTLAIGVPATHHALPEQLQGGNNIQ